MLIEEEKAVELCASVMKYADRLSESRSRFLQSFEPNVARLHARLLNDFWRIEQLQSKRILDIGPGLFPFSIIARELGATVMAIEFDEALADVGRMIGFEVHTDNLDMLPEGKFVNFDGVFLKGPFNPCRQRLDTLHQATQRIVSTIPTDGWGWIANSVHPRRHMVERRRLLFKRSERLIKSVNPAEGSLNNSPFDYHLGSDALEIGRYNEPSMVKALTLVETLTQLQKENFENLGWTVEIPTDYECRRYALTYQRRPYVFSKNLKTLAQSRLKRIAQLKQ